MDRYAAYSVINNEFSSHTASQTQPNGEKIIVMMDGMPDEQMGLTEIIIDASEGMERDGKNSCFSDLSRV